MVTDGYRGVTIGYRVVNKYNIKSFTCASRTQQKLMSRLGIARQPPITIEIRSNIVFTIGMQNFLEVFAG